MKIEYVLQTIEELGLETFYIDEVNLDKHSTTHLVCLGVILLRVEMRRSDKNVLNFQVKSMHKHLYETLHWPYAHSCVNTDGPVSHIDSFYHSTGRHTFYDDDFEWLLSIIKKMTLNA